MGQSNTKSCSLKQNSLESPELYWHLGCLAATALSSHRCFITNSVGFDQILVAILVRIQKHREIGLEQQLVRIQFEYGRNQLCSKGVRSKRRLRLPGSWI